MRTRVLVFKSLMELTTVCAEVRGQFVGVSPILPRLYQGPNSCHQAWLQALLPTEPNRQARATSSMVGGSFRSVRIDCLDPPNTSQCTKSSEWAQTLTSPSSINLKLVINQTNKQLSIEQVYMVEGSVCMRFAKGISKGLDDWVHGVIKMENVQTAMGRCITA